MPGSIRLIGILVCVAAGFAQQPRHDVEDQNWALKSRLPRTEVRAIRIAAGINDTDEGRIENLDVTSLNQRRHILLVEYRRGCVRLHVIERNGESFREVWALTGLKDRAWSIEPISEPAGRGVCFQAPRGPSAHVSADGQIVLEVPTLIDPFQRSMPPKIYSFTWDGASYLLQP